MSTTFAFTFPRRVALSTGLRLVAWARRPEPDASERARAACDRRVAEIARLARRQALEEQRERDIMRFLTQVGTF